MKLRLTLLILLPLILVACSDKQDGSSGSTTPLSVTQSDGQVLKLETTPKRIVSLAADATEIVCAIDGGDSLVAVEKFANCPRGSKSKPELDAFQPNLEAIVKYQPDLVLVFSNQGEIVQALRRAGTPVLFLDSPSTLDGVYQRIELMGQVTGHADEAKSLVAGLQARQKAVTDKLVTTTKGPRIFHELSNDYYTVRSDTFIGELYKLLKASNIADSASSAYPQLSAEAIVAADPEVIVLADVEPVASVKQRPGWSAVSAVRNNRICEVDPDIVSQAGPRIIDGLEALARCLYP